VHAKADEQSQEKQQRSYWKVPIPKSEEQARRSQAMDTPAHSCLLGSLPFLLVKARMLLSFLNCEEDNGSPKKKERDSGTNLLRSRAAASAPSIIQTDLSAARF